MIKRFFNWIKCIEPYQYFGAFVVTVFAVLFFVCIPYSVYKETITHYDIILTYTNGDRVTVHCDYYGKKRDYIYYYVGDEIYYLNTAVIYTYYIVPVECDCSV